MPAPSLHARAFAPLHRALSRRRLQTIDVALRVQILLLAALVNGFVFWQVRLPLDAMHRVQGTMGATLALAGSLAAIVVVTALAIALRHRRRLDEPLAGPEWLALPVPMANLLEHLAWESRSRAWVGAAFAPGPLAAAVHFVPLWLIALEALAFAAVMPFAARIATRAAEVLRVGRDPAGERALRHFARVRARRRAARFRPPFWTRAPRWTALFAKDALLALRPTPARTRLLLPLAFAAASCAAWMLPYPAPLTRFVAFALALAAAAAWAELLIALSGCDPIALLRALPLSVGPLWLSRAASIALFTAALVAGHAFAARDLAPEALHIHLVWLAAAALAIGLLGAHYGITLGPRADIAQRFLALGLGIAMSASFMIPLLGWVVLLAAVLHSGRRVVRWDRIEFER